MRDLEALVVAAYVFADEYSVPARGGGKPLITDAELVALAVAQAAIGISSDRQFLGLIGRVSKATSSYRSIVSFVAGSTFARRTSSTRAASAW
jgi:hypothetical protein